MVDAVTTPDQPVENKVPPPVVNKPTPKTVINTPPAPVAKSLDEVIMACRKITNLTGTIILDSFIDYAVEMKAGKAMSKQQAVANQHKLMSAMDALVNADINNFKEVFNTVLNIVKANSESAFGEQYVMRYVDDCGGSPERKLAFGRFVHMLTTTADASKRRESLKAVNIERVMTGYFSEDAKSKIINFYADYK